MMTGAYARQEPPRVLWSLCTLLGLFVLLALVADSLLFVDTAPRRQRQPDRVEVGPGSGPLPDFLAVGDISRRKREFFAFLKPVIEAENTRLAGRRAELTRLYEISRHGGRLRLDEKYWLDELCREFRLDAALAGSDRGWRLLDQRVDVIPVDLALVQAATESGWGCSRFAREGNNLFGQWQYGGGGMVPSRRNVDATHQVARFSSVAASVRSYLRNLNTNPAYASLRRLRREQRLAGSFPDSDELVGGLLAYSQRREAYVTEIRAMLRINHELLVE